MKKKREPSNARIESLGIWTVIRPTCHPSAPFSMHHSTTHGIYEIRCNECARNILRIEVRAGAMKSAGMIEYPEKGAAKASDWMFIE
jgi:hypothetical protein